MDLLFTIPLCSLTALLLLAIFDFSTISSQSLSFRSLMEQQAIQIYGQPLEEPEVFWAPAEQAEQGLYGFLGDLQLSIASGSGSPCGLQVTRIASSITLFRWPPAESGRKFGFFCCCWMDVTKHQSWHLFLLISACIYASFFFWNDAFMLLGSAAFWRPRPWCPTVLQEISEQAVSWVLAGAKALGEILVLVDMAVLSFKGANVLKKKINPCRLPWNRLVIRLFFYLNTMTHSSPMCLRKQKIGAGEATADCCHLFQKSVFFISKSAEQYLSNYEKHPARNQGAQSKQEHVSPWFPEVQ